MIGLNMSKIQFPKPVVSDLFLTVAIGQFVEIISNLPSGAEDGTPVPYRTNAYFIDADQDFYYLGDNPFEPTLLIKREDIRLIALIPEGPTSEEEQILHEMGEPQDESDIN